MHKRRWIRLSVFLSVVVVSTICGALVRESSFGSFLELKTYDFRFAFRDRRVPADIPITILSVDETALEKYPEPLMLWHRYFANAINALVRGGAAVIGIDFVFSDITQYDAPGQQALSEALILAGAGGVPIVLGYRVVDAGVEQPPDSIRMAAAVGHSFAYLNLTTDEDDFVRRQQIRSKTVGSAEPGFAFALANAYLAAKSKPSLSNEVEDTVLINYRRPHSFAIESFSRPIEAAAANDEAYLKKAFGGRIVLIARIGKRGDEDLHATPHYYWRAGLPPEESRRTPGIEIHANTITTLMKDGPIRRQTPGEQTAVNILTVFLLTICSMALKPARAVLASLALLLIVGYVAFSVSFRANLWMDVVPPLAAGSLALGMTQTLNFVIEGRDKRRIRQIFGRYVNDKVIEKILSESERLLLRGNRQPVAVLFADIKGFTTRSEQTPAEQVVLMLNDYFTGVIDAIQRHSGMVNSLMGDGLMAIFGAPFEDPRAAMNSIEAGREMLRALGHVNQKLKERHVAPIEIGIGIHYGDAVVGNMGSPRKMEYTAIGDVVNTASRIEGLTRKVEAAILITGETFAAAGKPAWAEYVGEFEVKGRASRVSIYRVPA
ncbi:MAG: CHASE2 domain-containing protein [Acidobacteria bacterium]|nr:CHASE2 domain-containing protein [Acidobacteriota bacterium]